MKQPGLFHFSERLARIDKVEHQLIKLNEAIHFEQFLDLIEIAMEKQRKYLFDAKGYDAILIHKKRIFQSRHNLSDDALEYPILNRYLFSLISGNRQGSKVPDAGTIFMFSEKQVKADVSGIAAQWIGRA